MSVLVTGGAGYIGSVTTQLLREAGEDVVVLDNLSRGHREAVAPEVPFYEGSVGDAGLVSRIAADHGVTACLHFAALAYVGESMSEPERYFENNVGEGLRLLGALLRSGVRQFIFSSTCAIYGEPEEIPIPVDHVQSPANPYGWTKLILEKALSSYDEAHALRHVALRYFNASGAIPERGESHTPETHLIPNVLLAAAGRKTHIEVFGSDYATPDGTAIRDYIHVADLAHAHALALAHLRAGKPSAQVNLGTQTGHSILEVIETARRVTGKSIEVRMSPRRPGDPSRLVADASSARRILGWSPRRPELSDAIASAWEWLQNHPDGYVDSSS